jgi:hypothetical protein
VQYVDFKPIAPVQQNCCIEFQIPPSQNSYVDLKHSFLQVKALLVKSDGSPITESDMGIIGMYDTQGNKLNDEQLAAEEQKKVCPANLLLSSMFSQCDLSLQQKIISPTVGNNYAYKGMLDCLVNEATTENENTRLATQLYKRDRYPGNISMNVFMITEREMYLNGKIMCLQGPLRCDLCELDRFIPSGVDIRIKLYQSTDMFRINTGGVEGITLKLVDATLKVCHIKLTPEETVKQDERMKKQPIPYDYSRSDIKGFQLASGSYTIQLENIYNGEIPQECIIAFVSSEGYAGSYKRNPFNFNHYNLNHLEITVDGVSVPGTPITTNFKEGDYSDAYLRLMNANENQELGIYYEDFPNGNALFRFDLQPLPTKDQRGNLRISARFSEALPEGVTLLIYSKFRDCFYIDHMRNVIQQ